MLSKNINKEQDKVEQAFFAQWLRDRSEKSGDANCAFALCRTCNE
jgi:hypothetical protein